jgi:hypothetical protein
LNTPDSAKQRIVGDLVSESEAGGGTLNPPQSGMCVVAIPTAHDERRRAYNIIPMACKYDQAELCGTTVCGAFNFDCTILGLVNTWDENLLESGDRRLTGGVVRRIRPRMQQRVDAMPLEEVGSNRKRRGLGSVNLRSDLADELLEVGRGFG